MSIRSPLELAMDYNQLETLRFLLEKDVRGDLNEDKASALYHADSFSAYSAQEKRQKEEERIKFVKLLLEVGANPFQLVTNEVDKEATPFSKAVESGNKKLVELYLANREITKEEKEIQIPGESLFPFSEDEIKWTVLDLVFYQHECVDWYEINVRNERLEIIKLLINNGFVCKVPKYESLQNNSVIALCTQIFD